MRIRNVLLACLLFSSWAVQAFAEDLTIAVAANVQYPFEELKGAFEKTSEIQIIPVVGSSGKLSTQIINGAPFDLFLSADMEYPEKLQDAGLTTNIPRIYAYGILVLWTLNDVDLTKGFHVMTDPSVSKIALASPKTAPYGREAIHALEYFRLDQAVSQKLIYGESIAQVNQFITSQAADLGFTAKSVVLSPNLKGQGQWIEVDPAAYEPIAQGAVILKHAEQGHLEAAQKFFDFIYSKEAETIFKKYGYVLPSEKAHE